MLQLTIGDDVFVHTMPVLQLQKHCEGGSLVVVDCVLVVKANRVVLSLGRVLLSGVNGDVFVESI